MAVRKKEEGKDVFEDVVKRPDNVIQFTIISIDRQIARYQDEISNAQAEIEKLITRKTAAKAL